MRRRIIEWVFVLVALASVAGQVAAQGSSPSSRTSVTDTVHVAPPTGETETDRASILAALDEVQPGGTVRFAPGTYLIGEIIHVTVPGISLVGHPDGTTLRGCDPDIFPRHGGLEEIFVAVVSCNGFDMAGGHQTVRALTFEYAWHALVLGGMECVEGRGCVPVLEPVETRLGGYLVRGNTFRNSANGVRTIGEWTEPAVIRENRFVNTFHAAEVHGSTVHFLDNDISVPEPEHVPSSGHPGGAVGLSATDLNGELALRCAGNIIAGNRIEGHPDGISIALLRPGTSCRDNVVRDNTIRVARVRVAASSWAGVTLTDADSSVVGVPLALVGSPEAYDLPISVEDTGQEGRLGGNLIKGNHIQGAEGLGMELYRASGNRIVDNIIEDIQQRTPYPGRTVNSTNPEKAGWRDANGAGIWISPGSEENEIVGNTFEDIAGAAVFLDGDDNRVELRSAGDSVRDLGRGNRVTAADSAGSGSDPRAARIDSIFSDLDSEDSPGCAVGVYRAGEMVFARGYGMASLEHGIPLSPRSVLGVGSVAKQFTALAVVLLAQRGELSLDDPVREHIPELPAYAAPVTVRHLIHHTSGLRDNVALLRLARGQVEDDGERVTLSMLAWQEALNFRPGEHWMYSNPGYLLLARIVERVSGQSFREFTDREIFDALGMTNSGFLGPVTTAGRALAYERYGTDGYQVKIPTHSLVGSTGLYTTIEDLAKWDRNFYDMEVGSREGIAQMHTPGRLNSGRETARAFGLELGRYRGLRTVGSSGGDSGYASMLLRFPEERLTVAVLCNMMAAFPWLRAYEVADHYLADESLAGPNPSDAARSADVSVTREELQALTGVYESSDGISLQHFTIEDGALVVSVARGRYPLIPVGHRRFTDGLTHFALTFRDSEPEGEMLAVWSPNPTPRSRDPLRLRRIGPRWTPRAEELPGYTGTFYSEELDASWRIVRRDRELVLRRWGVADQPLWSLVEDAFSFRGGTDPRLRFRRDADGSITGFSLSSDQIMDMEFVRTRDRDARR